MMFKTTMRKLGNDLGIIIPKRIVKELKLKEGDTMYIEIVKVKN